MKKGWKAVGSKRYAAIGFAVSAYGLLLTAYRSFFIL